MWQPICQGAARLLLSKPKSTLRSGRVRGCMKPGGCSEVNVERTENQRLELLVRAIPSHGWPVPAFFFIQTAYSRPEELLKPLASLRSPVRQPRHSGRDGAGLSDSEPAVASSAIPLWCWEATQNPTTSRIPAKEMGSKWCLELPSRPPAKIEQNCLCPAEPLTGLVKTPAETLNGALGRGHDW